MLQLNFEKVILHNFGSYAHAELDLSQRGFCFVSGKNNYAKDNAASNGSGKSFIWSAICFALTGETINGLTKNLKNINVPENEMWVELHFMADKANYIIKRGMSPAKNLSIIKDDIDISGKTFTESLTVLENTLPELSKDLIASSIILGQSMPHKFSSFSPSGRKELLEKLTKADYMIEDIKSRVLARLNDLSSRIRDYEDNILTNTTRLTVETNAKTEAELKLNTTVAPDFDVEIEKSKLQLDSINKDIQATSSNIKELEIKIEEINTKLISKNNEKAAVEAQELAGYHKKFTELSTDKTSLTYEVSNIKKEIIRLKSIKDICPTCGQKIPGQVKPDTSALESSLKEQEAKLNNLLKQIDECNAKHFQYKKEIENDFANDLISYNNELAIAKKDLIKNKDDLADFNHFYQLEFAKLSKLESDKNSWDSYYTSLKEAVALHDANIKILTETISTITAAKADLTDRLAIVKKMDTLAKRDFRGFLLTNIINYIDKKSKDFCEIVFGTRDLAVELNGNSLDVTYCNKMIDNLSGGEKTRVDLILQLAIRSLLQNYLGFNSNILVLDEVTDFLDSKSCKAVMKLINQEAGTIESVFIISHRANELELPVDSEINIIKNEQGISEIL